MNGNLPSEGWEAMAGSTEGWFSVQNDQWLDNEHFTFLPSH